MIHSLFIRTPVLWVGFNTREDEWKAFILLRKRILSDLKSSGMSVNRSTYIFVPPGRARSGVAPGPGRRAHRGRDLDDAALVTTHSLGAGRPFGVLAVAIVRVTVLRLERGSVRMHDRRHEAALSAQVLRRKRCCGRRVCLTERRRELNEGLLDVGEGRWCQGGRGSARKGRRFGELQHLTQRRN